MPDLLHSDGVEVTENICLDFRMMSKWPLQNILSGVSRGPVRSKCLVFWSMKTYPGFSVVFHFRYHNTCNPTAVVQVDNVTCCELTHNEFRTSSITEHVVKNLTYPTLYDTVMLLMFCYPGVYHSVH